MIKTWQERTREKVNPSFRDTLTDDELSIIGTKEMLAEIEDLRAAMGLLKRTVGLLKKARHHLDMHGQEYGHPRQNALISEIDVTTQGWKP